MNRPAFGVYTSSRIRTVQRTSKGRSREVQVRVQVQVQVQVGGSVQYWWEVVARVQ